MRLTSIIAIAALAISASAQTPKPKTTTAPAPKPAAKAATPAAKAPAPATKTAAKTSMPAAKTPATAAKPATANTTSVKTAPAKAAPAKAPSSAKTAAPAKTATTKPTAKPAAKLVAKPVAKAPAPPATNPSPVKKDAAPEIARTGRRDPFISPVRLAEERMRNNPGCSTGARCLVINQLVLKGTVKTQNGMIAMVENAAKKEYNLHEKDTVQNGSVLKITGDSIVFQESSTDPLGRSITKEVVKRVTVPAV